MRTITVPMSGAVSATLAFYIGTGSRYEKSEINGVSHFLEHMLFKGSENFPTAKDIFESIEKMGGILNGWTDVEATAYWVKVPADRVSEALKVLTDLVFRPLFDSSELEKERGVVLEELARRNDHPDEMAVELLGETIWPDQALGRWIIGTPESLARINGEKMKDYWRSQYAGGNIIFSAAGAVNPNSLISELEGYLPAINEKSEDSWEKEEGSQSRPRFALQEKKTDQAHLALGFRSLPNNHPQRFTLDVLSTVLGEGASSRLFQNIREKLGLAYSVGSGVSFFHDTGETVVHAGLNLGKTELALREILKELQRIKTEPVLAEELYRAKEMMKGHLLLGLEGSHNVVDFYARQELLLGEILNPEEVVVRTAAVTADEILELAQDIFRPEKLNLALVGPFSEKDKSNFQSIIGEFS